MEQQASNRYISSLFLVENYHVMIELHLDNLDRGLIFKLLSI